MTNHYKLDGKTPVLCDDFYSWFDWYAYTDRDICKTIVYDVLILTVFTGRDLNLGHDDAPVFFETQVFGGLLDRELKHHATWEDAERGHAEMVERVKKAE